MKLGPSKLSMALACVLLIGGVLAVYAPTLHYPFINFDDLGYIIQNPHVQIGLSWDTVKWAFTSYYAGNWHPIAWLSHALDCQLYGLNAGGHHLTNVVLHAANTALVFLVLLTLLRESETSAFKLQTSGEPQDPNTKHQAPEKLQKFNAESAKGAETRREQHQTEEPTAKYAKYAKPEDRISGTQPPDSVVAMPQSAMTSATQNPESRIQNRPSRLSTVSLQPSSWLSAFVAGIFGLHPMHVESVAWIAERKDVLSTFFFLLTIWAYVRYARRYEDVNAESAKTAEERKENPIVPGSKFFYGLALVLFALGLMSKPMLVTTPFVLLLLDFWPLGRVQIQRSRIHSAIPARVIIEKIPFFVLAAADSVLTFFAQKGSDAVVSSDVVPVGDRLSNAAISYVAYLRKLIWPGAMSVYYPYRESPTFESTFISFLLLVAITVCVVWLIKKKPYLAVGWFWFLGTLVPVIGVVQVGLQAMADRYTYVPYIGLSLAIACLVADSIRTVPKGAFYRAVCHPATFLILCLGILIAFAINARAQVHVWRDSEALWRHALEITPDNAVIRGNLAGALFEQRKFEDAAREFENALKIKAGYAQAEANLGFTYAMLGKQEAAVECYRRSIAMKWNNDRAHFLLANTLNAQGNRKEAIAEYETALKINPDLPVALNDLAWIFATDPDPAIRDGAQAVTLAERACSVTAYRIPQFIGTLAAAYAEAARYEDAVSTAEKAKQLAAKQGSVDLVRNNEALLNLYRMGKPYRAPEDSDNNSSVVK